MPSATSGIQLKYASLFPAIRRSAELFRNPSSANIIILRQGNEPLRPSLTKQNWMSRFFEMARRLRTFIGFTEVYYLDNLTSAGEDLECLGVLLQSQPRGIIIEKLVILPPTPENLAKMKEGTTDNDHYTEGQVKGRTEAMRINKETKEAMMTYGCSVEIANAAIEKAVGSAGAQMDAPKVAVVQAEITLIAKHLIVPPNLPEDGTEACLERLSQSGDNGSYLLKLAFLYVGEGDFDQAIIYFNRRLERTGVDCPPEQLFMLYYNLGLAYFAKRDVISAEKEFLAARRIAPARTEIQAFLADAVLGSFGEGAKEKAETIKGALGIT